jgi:hypothetical protein
LLVSNSETVGDSHHVLTNFVVPESEHWHVTGLFSNNAVSRALEPLTQARWSIRTGVAKGQFGSRVASGVVPAAQTPTGRLVFSMAEVTISVHGLSVELGPGSYYAMISPITMFPCCGVGVGVSVNRVGTPGAGGTFEESHTSDLGGPFSDGMNKWCDCSASIGVLGSSVNSVPLLFEPTAIAVLYALLMMTGLFAIRIRLSDSRSGSTVTGLRKGSHEP